MKFLPWEVRKKLDTPEMHKRIEREMARVDSMTSLTAKQKASIKHNMLHGLLCACNKAMIPYFAEDGDPGPHGQTETETMIHGYDDCQRKDRLDGR